MRECHHHMRDCHHRPHCTGFQLANLWLVIVGGTFFSQISDIVSGDATLTEIVNNIAGSVPYKSQFFLQMVIQSLLAGLGAELSRVWTLLVSAIFGWVSFRPIGTHMDCWRASWARAAACVCGRVCAGCTCAGAVTVAAAAAAARPLTTQSSHRTCLARCASSHLAPAASLLLLCAP
jgi:Calcium-dependent channel, 7TM region, putative phosphate